jgi:hypothetical protein
MVRELRSRNLFEVSYECFIKTLEGGHHDLLLEFAPIPLTQKVLFLAAASGNQKIFDSCSAGFLRPDLLLQASVLSGRMDRLPSSDCLSPRLLPQAVRSGNWQMITICQAQAQEEHYVLALRSLLRTASYPCLKKRKIYQHLLSRVNSDNFYSQHGRELLAYGDSSLVWQSGYIFNQNQIPALVNKGCLSVSNLAKQSQTGKTSLAE